MSSILTTCSLERWLRGLRHPVANWTKRNKLPGVRIPLSPLGYSLAWLKRLSGGQKTVGSNPATPTSDLLSQHDGPCTRLRSGRLKVRILLGALEISSRVDGLLWEQDATGSIPVSPTTSASYNGSVCHVLSVVIGVRIPVRTLFTKVKVKGFSSPQSVRQISPGSPTIPV